MWSRGPIDPPWPAGEVHLWRAGTVRLLARMDVFAGTLSEDERERADRYLAATRRKAFIVVRGVLRTLLGRYLRVDPQAIHFSYTETGKPEPAGAPAESGLRFNLSHSGDLVLYAITADRDIGVDIEYIREGTTEGRMRIARRFFSSREYEMLRRLPAEARQAAFFTCWTRKEAFIKARGDGLSLPLDQFAVTVSPDAPATLLHTAWDGNEAARWSLRTVHPGAGYAATLAVEGEIGACRHWEFL